jgi:hypothetical protein
MYGCIERVEGPWGGGGGDRRTMAELWGCAGPRQRYVEGSGAMRWDARGPGPHEGCRDSSGGRCRTTSVPARRVVEISSSGFQPRRKKGERRGDGGPRRASGRMGALTTHRGCSPFAARRRAGAKRDRKYARPGAVAWIGGRSGEAIRGSWSGHARARSSCRYRPSGSGRGPDWRRYGAAGERRCRRASHRAGGRGAALQAAKRKTFGVGWRDPDGGGCGWSRAAEDATRRNYGGVQRLTCYERSAGSAVAAPDPRSGGGPSAGTFRQRHRTGRCASPRERAPPALGEELRARERASGPHAATRRVDGASTDTTPYGAGSRGSFRRRRTLELKPGSPRRRAEERRTRWFALG